MAALFLFLFGLCIGSFLNVLVLRLKASEALTGRSRCTHCHAQLLWYHNIPLLSFLFLRGRCAFCHTLISWQYPSVELASALVWLMAYLRFSSAGWLDIVAFGVFANILLVLFVFDFRWYILPDEITLTGIALALAFNLARGFWVGELVISTCVGALFFALQYILSRGRWVGSGDIRLGALVGAMVGTYIGLGVTLLVAYVAGSIVGLALIAFKRRSLKSQLPFGAFVAPAAIIALLGAEPIWAWYLGLLGW